MNSFSLSTTVSATARFLLFLLIERCCHGSFNLFDTIHHCKFNKSNTNITNNNAITGLTTEGYIEDVEPVADVIDSESPKDEDNDNPYIIPKCITNQVDTEVIDTNSLLEDGNSDPSKIVFNVRFDSN